MTSPLRQCGRDAREYDRISSMRAESDPLFTVVTVTWNDLAGLKRTHESLLSQGGSLIEWVVIDGGSSDGSIDWLGKLDEPIVRWTSGPDAGIYDAMNKGIRAATGDLLVFLGAGDRLARGALEIVAADWAQHRWLWAYGLSRIVSEQQDLLQVAAFVPFRRRWLELGYRALNHQACFFSHDLVTQLGEYNLDFPIFADQEFCIRAAAVAPPRVLGEVVAEFVAGGVSWQVPAGSFVWPARQIRRANRRLIGNNTVLDLLLASLIWLDLRARDAFTRRMHRKG